MFCIIINYKYKIIDNYDEDVEKYAYEIYFHSTENDCKLRFISVKSKLLEIYNKRESNLCYTYELYAYNIRYSLHEVPHEDYIF